MGPAPTTTGGQWLGAEPEIQILSKILFFILRAVKSRFMGFFFGFKLFKSWLGSYRWKEGERPWDWGGGGGGRCLRQRIPVGPGLSPGGGGSGGPGGWGWGWPCSTWAPPPA